MRYLLILFSVAAAFSCTQQKSHVEDSGKAPLSSDNKILPCFEDLDTTTSGQTIACAGNVYKLINDKYLIRIEPKVAVQYDSCYSIEIGRSIQTTKIELLVFDNKNASLTNICTDLIMPDAPAPTRKRSPQSGKLRIGFTGPTKFYGNSTYHTSIFIEHMTFVDHETGEKIEINNELLWKVLDLGTPG